MVKRQTFQRGDIVRVSLNPAMGREQQGDFRPALVLSPAAFNIMGVALVAPINKAEISPALLDSLSHCQDRERKRKASHW